MLGALLVAAGLNALALGLPAALAAAGAGMIAFAAAFTAWCCAGSSADPSISLLMVTLGLGALMRGTAAVVFRGIPSAIRFRFRSTRSSWAACSCPRTS